MTISQVTELLVVSGRIDDLESALRPRLPDTLRAHFCADADAAREYTATAQIAIGAPDVLAPLVDDMPALRWVQSTWAGVTPFFEVPRRDYVLTGLKGVFGRSMSEFVLGWMLAIERSIIEHATRRRWLWRADRGLASLRLGIAGLGDIGGDVARYCAPFVQEVVGLNSDGRAHPHCSRCFPGSAAGLRDFAAGLDMLVMILPDTPSTDRLVGADVISGLNDGASLINVGRGNSLDIAATVDALRGGKLKAAVLDVLDKEPLVDDDPLWGEPGVYITSHTSAPTTMDAIVDVFLENLWRFSAGAELLGRVDFERGY